MAQWSLREREVIEAVVAERLEGLLEPGERVRVDGSTDPGQIEGRFVLRGGKRGEELTIEARIAPFAGEEAEAREVLLDALDLLLLEYLEAERRLVLPGVWEERELRGRALAVRRERRFPDLDAQADDLLDGGEGS